MSAAYAEARNIVFPKYVVHRDRACMKRTRKNEVVAESRIASIWRRVARLFRDDHKRCQSGSDLLIASLTAFNTSRIYLLPDFNPPLRLILSRL